MSQSAPASVLIVGPGPISPSLAVEFARRGTRPRVVERTDGLIS